MKIAIRGHELRGKEVIQILESLGGTGARGAVAQYCPWYRVWNLNGKAVLGPNDGKNICPFESN